MNDPMMDTAVVPLQLRRRSSQKAFSRSSISKRLPSNAGRSKSLPRARSQRQPKMEQFTPPLTPSSSVESLTPSGTPISLQFHDYVRALYAYHPPYDRNSDTVTLPLNCGDIFLVHSVHPSGWADGTLLDSGIRGWLPTNFCEPYNPGHMHNLLSALTQLHVVVPNCARGDVSPLRNLSYTRPMVAGVRYLLDSTKCLGRDAHLVAAQTGSSGLRRYRKGMLGELSTFLRYAEDVARALKVDYTQGDLEGHCNQLMLDACRTVLRAAKFHDIWTEEIHQNSCLTIDVSAADNLTPKPPQRVPPTPPAENSDTECSSDDTGSPLSGWTVSSNTPTQPRPILAPAIVTARDVCSPEPSGTYRQFPVRGASLAQRGRPLSMQNVRRASYRISVITRLNEASLANSALDKLTKTYERLNENLMSFGVISPGVSTPNDVLLATGETLQSGRQMLRVVDAVCKRSEKNFALAHAQDQMYRQLMDLVVVAQQVFDENSPIPLEQRMSPASLQGVSECATQCIRTAHECSSASLRILEHTGDFELEEHIPTPKALTRAGTPTEIPPPVSPVEPVHVECEEADVETPDAQEPLDVSEFPMPGMGAPTLPPLDTGVVSLDEISSLPSASTIATPDSQHSSAADTYLSTPCTPLSAQAPGIEECTPETEDASSMAVGPAMSTPTSQSTSARNSSRSLATLVSSATTSPDCSTDCFVTPYESVDEIEKTIQAQTFAHELCFGKDGQICGGSLSALVERLTSSDSIPEPFFVTTFFLTFRIFTTPSELAQALINRFESLEDDDAGTLPVRLRVYNILKQWLESYWRADTDRAALDIITPFAETRITMALPNVGSRLLDLTQFILGVDGPMPPRQNSVASGLSATGVPTLRHLPAITTIPSPVISKQELAALTSWKNQGTSPKITDFNSLELARQLTVRASNIYCAIRPEELLQREWAKDDSLAVNVKAMSQLSNDLVSFIVGAILASSEVKERAKTIKHWIKIGSHCLDLNNLFVVMQVSAALASSSISRLTKSWDYVPTKHKKRLLEMNAIFVPQYNSRVYRQRLEACVGPRIPFLGTHQTDLYHIDDYERDFRPAPAGSDYFTKPLINMEKHIKTARVIIDIQRHQIAYRLEEVKDIQAWFQEQLAEVSAYGCKAFLAKQQEHYERSCKLEPRLRADSQPDSLVSANK